jgi:hypothetical protein
MKTNLRISPKSKVQGPKSEALAGSLEFQGLSLESQGSSTCLMPSGARQLTTDHGQRDEHPYALGRGLGFWELTFEGRRAIFKDELGALYVAYLLLEPPREPIPAVALAFKAKEKLGRPAGPAEVVEQQVMGLEDAASVQALWRKQRELERILADRREIEPVKAEAQRELEEITEHLRQSPWLSRHGAERCARAVAAAIKRLHAHLAAAVDAEGKPDEVLRAFALHLSEHLLAPSGRGGSYTRAGAWTLPGWFIYVPSKGIVWEGQSADCGVQSPSCGVQSPKSKVQSLESSVQGSRFEARRPAAMSYLSQLLCVGVALALLASGCAGPRPLKGGRAVTTHKPAGVVEQTLVQGENPAQATKQDQESLKVRTYTVPAGSRVEQSQPPVAAANQNGVTAPVISQLSTINSQLSTTSYQPSTSFVLSAPMPVVEREESRARTELGAAQKDTARELGAKLSSLKGIVWVGVGLFVFGLASLVWPPLKAVIGSVTTSAALTLGGLALMVLPSLIVGNELLILGGVGVAVGGWFLAHRHGQVRGLVAASTGTPEAATGDQKS